MRALHTEPGRHTFAQDELAQRMRDRIAPLPQSRDVSRIVGFIYERSEIRKRHVEASMAQLSDRTDWLRLVNEAAVSLAERTLLGIDDELGDCDAFVVVCSSFSGFPSLSRRLQQSVGLPLHADCYDLTGLGCAGPTQGLHFAQQLLHRDGIQKVCLLCVDVMGTQSESRRHVDVPDLSQVVAHCLASDGAAAVIIGSEPGADPLFSYRDTHLKTRLWADALQENDLAACEHNQPFLRVGKQIRTRLIEETKDFFDEETLNNPLLLHPGGTALMRMLGKTLPSLAATIDVSTDMLRDNGNIGSASVLWVLENALEAGMPMGPELRLFALGPGIVTTLLHLEGVEQHRGIQ